MEGYRYHALSLSLSLSLSLKRRVSFEQNHEICLAGLKFTLIIRECRHHNYINMHHNYINVLHNYINVLFENVCFSFYFYLLISWFNLRVVIIQVILNTEIKIIHANVNFMISKKETEILMNKKITQKNLHLSAKDEIILPQKSKMWKQNS